MEREGISFSAAYCRQWRAAHPEEAAAKSKRDSRRQQGRKVLKGIQWRAGVMRRRDRTAEVMRHHAKGRSIAEIVVWTQCPASQVVQILKANGVKL